jgi:hypothetical protein
MSDPVTACFALGASELIRRPSEFKPQEIKDVLWSFARVGMRHPALFQTVAEHLVGRGDDPIVGGRGLSTFNSQGTSNLAYAFAKHSQIGSEVLDQYGKQCRLPAAGGRLGCYTVSFLDVGEGLLRKLFAEIVRVDLELHGMSSPTSSSFNALHNLSRSRSDLSLARTLSLSRYSDDLRKLSPQDISNTVWSFGILGIKHSEFLKTVSENLQLRMKSYLGGNKNTMNRIKGQELSNSLLAMASLNFTPPELLRTVEAYLMNLMTYEESFTVPMIAGIFTRQELANLAWAVSVFGVYPKHLLEIIYMGLTGIGDRSDPSYVQQSFGDAGIERSHIISLLYLQTTMDLDAGQDSCAFRPPDNFPGAWTTKLDYSNHPPGDDSTSSSMMDEDFLELNTSKTQNDVSRAFSRIGFAHVEEFVHTMEDLAIEYGIQMSPYPTQLLSIDFANVESKIGVEVDGPAHFITRIDGREGAITPSVGYFDTKHGKLRYDFKWNEHDQEINGSTALKQRILKQLGWRIINIPFWDWQVVTGDAVAEDEFCRNLLDKLE